MSVYLDERFSFETPEGIAQGDPAHSELVRDLDLRQTLSWNKNALSDRPPEFCGHRGLSGNRNGLLQLRPAGVGIGKRSRIVLCYMHQPSFRIR